MKFLNSITATAALAAVIASCAGAEVKAGETLYGTVLKQVSVSGDLSHKDGQAAAHKRHRGFGGQGRSGEIFAHRLSKSKGAQCYLFHA